MNFGSQILILYAVEFFAALNNTCISARTLALLLLYNSYIRCCPYKRHIPTRLLFRRICINNANVPADLQSAGIKYKDFSIRLLPIFY